MAKPNTPNTAVPTMNPAMPSPPTPSDQGNVMVQVPKSVFMEVHSIIVQLAQTMDALAVEVEGTSGGSGALLPGAPVSAPTDADLEAFANELNQRGAM